MHQHLKYHPYGMLCLDINSFPWIAYSRSIDKTRTLSCAIVTIQGQTHSNQKTNTYGDTNCMTTKSINQVTMYTNITTQFYTPVAAMARS
jgi:hypothetical protein